MTNLQHTISHPSGQERLRSLRRASRSDLRRLARNYDWSKGSETVLGWMMAQKGMDLGTALTVFFNGDPARFNYLPKTHVPEAHHGASVLLDNICLRINSGFYRVATNQRFAHQRGLDRWLNFQAADRADGRRGRWILDENIVRAVVRPVDESSHTEEADMLERLQEVARPARPSPREITTRVLSRLIDMVPPRRFE